MAQYHGPELKHCEPNLQPGKKHVIVQFHDESCFHTNEFKWSAWCVLLWWDTKQLLTQVTNVIDIFNVTHPNCKALFIFDQSSAHASLRPDALQPFDMNKGNGGKQCKQKDTIIPNNNPTISLHGTVQRMMTESGETKGLQTVLKERGFVTKGICAKCSPVCPFENEKCCLAWIFNRQEYVINQVSMLEELITKAGHHCIFLPKFHCELNPIEMYWGYAKYHYCRVFKNTFADAKAAVSSLQSCPLDTL
ncbi:hypothetical protein BS47DRAFT_1374401 [Hydnum rufescens UP504]|uniref:Uncharacterized protein n=1 Tax=Hydnum rufescens UP504 TaxID=1448309 RepID=A0A9P6DN79_9AGAM|nr:hypothetical protein BS47DRAFT_1374401 [Hydnum rufescens UP504]